MNFKSIEKKTTCFKTNRYIYCAVLILILQSCNFDKSKIVGEWNISTFTINGETLDSKNYSNHPTAISMQFLDNGFFVMNMIDNYPHDPILKMGGFSSRSAVKGKWALKGVTKIELEFIDWFQDIGVQKGKYDLDGNILIINAKGDKDFSYFMLHK